MRKRTTSLIVFCLLAAFVASAQIDTPLPSPEGSVYSKVGLTEVTIDYFRPKKKGRKIFGAGDEYLVKYKQVWRTGANSGSKLTLSTDANVGGQDVKAGEYLILTVPDANEWKFILYSDPSIGGNIGARDKEKDALNVTVKPMALTTPVETLTFSISDISEDNTSANIYFAWDNASFKVPIKVDFDEAVMKSIAENTVVPAQNYATAANYYLSTGRDLQQALDWMNMYLSQGENANHFWHIHTKAKILAAMGKNKEAIATAKDSMEKAKNFPSGDFGYVKRNQELIESTEQKK